MTTQTKQKLLPCPFCGGEANIEYCGNPSSYMDFYARCTNEKCGCRLSVVDEGNNSVKAWNTRVNKT